MAPFQVVSPERITHDSIPAFLRLRAEVEHIQDCQIECDCSNLTFVDPMGLCLLKHWFVELEERDVTIELRGLRFYIESFLRRMDLFEALRSVKFDDRTSRNARRDLNGQVIELCTLTDTQEIGPVATKIASTIVHGIPDISFEPDPDGMQPSIGERMEETLEYVFSEILLNALDHGRKRNYRHAHANIAAQFYPKPNQLEVAIVDNGCGLLETLLAHPRMEGQQTDSQAITIARMPRVSCNRDAELGLDVRNQGIGLTVSTEIALAANGRCGIFSGESWHSLHPNNVVNKSEIPYWRGTGVYFKFDKNALLNVNKRSIIQALPGFRTVKTLNFG